MHRSSRQRQQPLVAQVHWSRHARSTLLMSKASKHAKTKFKKWLNSYGDVSSWIEKKCPDLEQLLDESGGLVKIENFLPPFVADGVLELLEAIDEKTWNLTSAQDDYVHNNIRHEFMSVKQGPPGLEDVFRVFTLLMPDSLFTFSAAKYCKNGHIVPHDDKAYTNVLMDDGSVQLCSRSIACIYYLTKDWSENDGGQLLDLEAPGGPQVHVPKYNSLIAFTIPRWHEVRPVTGSRPRYSVFGWFLEPGMLYELDAGKETSDHQQQRQGDLAVLHHDLPQQQQHKRHKQEHKQQQQLTKKPKKQKAPCSQVQQQGQPRTQAPEPQPRQPQQQLYVKAKKQKIKRRKVSGAAGELVASLAAPKHSSRTHKQAIIKKKELK